MKPEIIKADTAGMIVSWDNSKDVYYVGSSCPHIGNGVCYKNKQAFDDQEGICYVNEYNFYDEVAVDENVSDEMLAWMNKHNEWHVCMKEQGYTWEDLRIAVYDWIGHQLDCLDDHTYDMFVDYMQERLFDELDWQSPSTWLSELDPIEQWENCPQLCSDDPRFVNKKRYKVRLYFHTYVDVDVEADDEDDAKEEAYLAAQSDDFNSQYIANAEVDNDPDVECLDDLYDPRLTDKQKKELGYE